MNNANTTKNGLTNALAFLILTTPGYIVDLSSGTFAQWIDDHVLLITKSGKYWFDFDCNEQNTNAVFEFCTSLLPTSGYVAVRQCSAGNSTAPVFENFHGIIELNANTYLMMWW